MASRRTEDRSAEVPLQKWGKVAPCLRDLKHDRLFSVFPCSSCTLRDGMIKYVQK